MGSWLKELPPLVMMYFTIKKHYGSPLSVEIFSAKCSDVVHFKSESIFGVKCYLCNDFGLFLLMQQSIAANI